MVLAGLFGYGLQHLASVPGGFAGGLLIGLLVAPLVPAKCGVAGRAQGES